MCMYMYIHIYNLNSHKNTKENKPKGKKKRRNNKDKWNNKDESKINEAEKGCKRAIEKIHKDTGWLKKRQNCETMKTVKLTKHGEA